MHYVLCFQTGKNGRNWIVRKVSKKFHMMFMSGNAALTSWKTGSDFTLKDFLSSRSSKKINVSSEIQLYSLPGLITERQINSG